MQRTAVSSSSTLKSVGYDPQARILEIEYLNGSVYQYFAVPGSIHRGLMWASSQDSYLDARIKKGGYKHSRIS